MSIEDSDTIDFIGIERATGKVVLTVADHLEWDPPGRHLLALQTKLNTYLRFVESGELVTAYPDASGRAIALDLVLRFAPTEAGRTFLEHVRTVVEDAGFEFRSRAGPSG